MKGDVREEEKNKMVTIYEFTDSYNYHKVDQLLSHKKCSSGKANIDSRVDKLISSKRKSDLRYKSRKSRRIRSLRSYVRKRPVLKILILVAALAVLMTQVSNLLPELYGDTGEDVVISIDPRDVYAGDLIFINATIPAYYNITSVTADMGGFDKFDLELLNETLIEQKWQANWTVPNISAGEYFAYISAFDLNNSTYSATLEWHVLEKEVIVPVDDSADTNITDYLNLSIRTNKNIYLENETVILSGDAYFNDSQVNSTLNLNIFSQSYNLTTFVNVTYGQFTYEFIPPFIGEYFIQASTSFNNISAIENLTFEVVPVPPVNVTDYLNLSIWTDKNIYLENETVIIDGDVIFNDSQVNSTITLNISSESYNLTTIVNVTDGRFTYDFTPPLIGEYLIQSSVSFNNLSAVKNLTFEVVSVPPVDVTPVSIVDGRDEQLFIVPGTKFYVDRTVDGPDGEEVVFAHLYSDALEFDSIEMFVKSETGDIVQISEDVSLVKPREFVSGSGVSLVEKKIDMQLEKLPPGISKLNRVSYHPSIKLHSPVTVRTWFKAPSWEDIISGVKPHSGQISYMVLSKDGSQTYDYEGSTWWNSNWGYRKLITVNSSQVDADLTNFPILVNITDSDLSSKAQSDGDDIAYVLWSDNSTKLNHEIELFNGTTGELVCWVNVTSLSSSVDTRIWMYYGNDSSTSQQNVADTWDSNFISVLHFNETTGNHEDSTSYDNDGIPGGGVTQDYNGKIAGGDDFDGTDGNLTLGNSSFNLNSGTVEMWCNFDTFPSSGYEYAFDHHTNDGGVANRAYLQVEPSGVWSIGLGDNLDLGNCNSTLNSDNWYHLVLTWNSTHGIGWKDGEQDSPLRSYQNLDTVGNIWICSWEGSMEYVDGTIDELRVSKINRSSVWINTSYKNMNSPDTFLYLGSEGTNTAPTISGESPTNESTGQSTIPTLNVTVDDFDDDMLNATWWSNSSESWVQFASNNSIDTSSGSVNIIQTNSNFSNFSTIYWWSVNLTDGTNWTNETYHFTTLAINTSVDTIDPYQHTSTPLTINATGPSTLSNVTLWYRYSSDNSSWANDSNWWNAEWTYRKKLTINSSLVDGDLSNFPILVSFTDTNLTTAAQDDGDDIVFTNVTGTKLNHEIELFDDGTGQLIAWVNVTSLSSSSDTEIYMYYGNSSCSSQENVAGVWDSHFMAVHHLHGANAAACTDSTNNGNDITLEGGTPDYQQTGISGYAVQFVRTSSEYIGMSDAASLDLVTGKCLEVWVKYGTWSNGETMGLIEKWWDDSNRAYFLNSNKNATGGTRITFNVEEAVVRNDNPTVYEVALTTGTWYHFVGDWQKDVGSGNVYAYKDGVNDTDDTMTVDSRTNNEDVSLACDTQLAEPRHFFDGIMDEVRISDISRGSDWINTTYNTISSPSTFLTVGSEESWMQWDDVSNPDESGPTWSWEFDFPNSTGYYEFYSIGKKSGSTDETAPDSADAICQYSNAAPTLANENPSDGSSEQILTPQLNVTVDDSNDDTLNAYWYSNSSGGWVQFDSNLSIDTSSGAVNIIQTNSNFSNYSVTYYWSVNITDGTSWTNETYSFTTNYAPTQSGESPTNGATDQITIPTLNVTVDDADDDTLTTYWLSNSSGSWVQFGINSSGYEDLTTYTEVDPNSHITVNSSRVTHNSTCNEDAYVYKDFGANHFSNFEHDFTMRYDGAPNNRPKLYWGLSNETSTHYQWVTGNKYGIWVDFWPSQGIRLVERDGSNSYNDKYAGVMNTVYYLTVFKHGTTFYCHIYSDATRTNLLDNLTLTLHHDYTFRNLYVTSSWNLGDASVHDGWSENFGLNEAVSIVQTNNNFSNYSVTYYWSVNVTDGCSWTNETYHFTTLAINTSVDTITPYQHTSTPLTINATGPSDLDNVTLWYRYSANNNSWDGWCYQETATESTVCGGLDTGDYICLGDWAGSYPCSEVYDEDWDSYGQPNVGYPNWAYLYINYTKPTAAQNTSLWHVKDSDSTVNLSIPDDCWAQSPLRFKLGLEYDCPECNWYCYNGDDWDLLRGVEVDKAYEGSMWWNLSEPWIEWNDTSNPDTDYASGGWNWTFGFPNSTGYYEFYSIGKKSGSTDETPPGSADAICYYTPPVAPTVITNASTGVEETNATLWGYLSDNGSADTICGFRYGNSSGSYDNNITYGIVANGSTFSNDTTGLTPGQIYFYQAWANNSAGFANGSEMTFLTKPNVTTSFNATTYNETQINLTWVKGTGANNTYIERNASGDTVWARGDGTEIYNGSGTNYEDSGLSAAVTYYYQAWSYTNWTYNPTLHQWSDENASDSNNTDITAPSSNVTAITPYWYNVTGNPLTVTCTDATDTGGSGLKNVTLWYRYRATNASSWGGWVSSGLVDSDPWVAVSWSFTFSNGTGHYQFYSIATDNATNNESAPGGNGDTSCGYDTAAPTSSLVDGRISDTTISTFEWDAEEGAVQNPSALLHMGDSQYYLCSGYGDTGSDSDGFLRILNVTNNGDIQTSLADKWEYDTSDGLYAGLCHISGDVYAVTYYSAFGTTKGRIITTRAYSSNGTLQKTVIDAFGLNSSVATYPSLVHVTGNVYAAVYQEASGDYDYQLETVEISSDGVITDSRLDIEEFESTPTGTSHNSLHAVMIDSDTIAIVHSDSDDDGWLKTYNISAAGIITDDPADSWEWDTATFGYICPFIHHISGDVFAITYRDSAFDGQTKTVTISDAGMITKSWIDTLEWKNSDTIAYPVMFTIADASIYSSGIYGITYEDVAGDGRVCTMNISGDGTMDSAVIEELEFEGAVVGSYSPCVHVSGGFYLIVYGGPYGDGWSCTVSINLNGIPYLKTSSPIVISGDGSDSGPGGLKNVTLYYRFSTDNSSWGENTSFGADTTPWSGISWSFNFPNGTGYYEFYSIATDNATNSESSPGNADAICYYNPPVAPTVTTNSSTGVEEMNATLQGYLNNNGGNDTTCGFRYGNSSGSYDTNITYGIISSGTEFSNDATGLTPGQIYFYQAWANNSVGFANGSELTFLTKPNVTADLHAQANSSTVIYLTWTASDGANTTYIERNASGETVWARGAGIEIYNGSGNSFEDTGLLKHTSYYYQVWSYANWTYNPTLQQWSDENASANNNTNRKPIITLIAPVNGSTGVALQPVCQIWVNDSDGDSLNVTWAHNISGSYVNQYTNVSETANTTVSYNFTEFSNYSVTYYWKVYVDDGVDNVSEWFSFTTEPINTTVDSISQYEITSTPLTINASAQHNDYSNVSLWYRYSSDNSSWANDSNWWDAEWTYRMKLTIDSSYVEDDLINFPILVSFTDTNLTTAAQEDGDDIVFTNTTGTKLNHEIELFNDSTGQFIAWVNVTSLSGSSDTEIYMYYGNSTCSSQQNANDTWDSNYVGVWHMDDNDTANGIDDSTSYSHDGSDGGSTPTEEDGYIGKAQNFTVDSDWFVVSDDDDLDCPNVTMSLWFHGTTAVRSFFAYRGAINNGMDYAWGIWNDGARFHTYWDDIVGTYHAEFTSCGSMPAGEWRFAAITRDNNTNTIWYYLNGTTSPYTLQLLSTDTYADEDAMYSDGWGDLYLGAEDDTPIRGFDGLIDEIRISKIPRSPTWLNTTYNTTAFPDAFVSVGSEEAWVEWDNATQNPDTSSPWGWNFSFPNSTGYYEFYSIGKKSGSVDETPPNDADTICYYNPDITKPSISFDTPPTPANNTNQNENYAQINVTVSDSSNTSSFIDWNTSLIGYWNFEHINSTHVFDNSTYNHNASFGGATLGESNITTGKYGDALDFSDTDEHLRITRDTSLEPTDLTVELWVKLDGRTGGLQVMVDKTYDNDQSAPYSSYEMGYDRSDSDQLEMFFGWDTVGGKGTAYDWYLSSSGKIPIGEWNHIVCTFNDSDNELKMYINGSLDVTHSVTESMIFDTSSTGDLYIGSGPDKGYDLNGTLDEVRIWDRALTWEEINASYNSSDYKLYHNFTGLSDGNYSYYAHAIDVAGNENTTETRDLTIDTQAPISSVDSISPYVNITGSIEITATASDNTSGINDVTLWYRYASDNSSWGSWMENITDTDYNWNWTFNFPNSTGYYEFYSIATDNTSNIESAPGSADAICHFNPSLSVNITPSIWNMGSIWVDDSNETSGYYFTITNEGDVPVNVQINATNATNSSTGAIWVLNATADYNNYTLEYYLNGGSGWVNINLTYDDFINNLAVLDAKTFDLKVTTATVTSSGDPLQAVVRFKSVAS